MVMMYIFCVVFANVFLDDLDNNTYILQYGTVSTIDNTECQKIYGSDVVRPGVVCTVDGPSGESPCYGDGGAPLVLDADGDAVLVGILSFLSGVECGGEYPSRFTRVASYRDWIKEKINI